MAQKKASGAKSTGGGRPKSSAQSKTGTQSKTSAKKRGAGRKADPEQRLIETAMTLAAERGWSSLSVQEIAEAAGLSLAEAYDLAPSKRAILDRLSRRVDRAVLAEGALDEADGGAHDRIFDVMMRRYDALQPYREGLGEVILDLGRDPVAALCGAPQLACSMAWMLTAAGVPTDGVRGRLRVKGLAMVHLMTLRTWLRDDSADLGKTMAALDRNLRRIRPLARKLTPFGRGTGEEPPAEGAGATA